MNFRLNNRHRYYIRCTREISNNPTRTHYYKPMSEVAASYMITGKQILQYLLDAGEAQFPVEVKWGKGHRNVVLFKGKNINIKVVMTLIKDY